MKFLITSSLIISAVFLLGASTSSNAKDMQPLFKNTHDSNIIKVRGGGVGGGFGHMGGGGFGHMGGGGFGHGGGNFGHHDFDHHRDWNEDWGVGVYDDPSFYYGDPGYDVYDTGPDTGVCVGPYCPESEY